ncbi:hypothetical protein [Ancylobacter koreensis]|nr:hypothetical protein [Ancylobacter koreensis]
MILLTLRTALAAMFRRIDRRLTEATYRHGCYCIGDLKIRPRDGH